MLLIAFLNLSDVILSLLLYIIVIISNAAYSLELNLILI